MSSDRTPSPPKRFRLTRNFALLSAIVLLATALGLSLLYRSWAVGQMVAEAEQANVTAARLLANSLLNWNADILSHLAALPPDQLATRPEVAELEGHIGALVRQASIIKVKIYNLDGHTLFSTARDEIGKDEDDDEGVAAAAKGVVASELVHANTLDAFEGRISDRDVISSYVPIRAVSSQGIAGAEGPVIGVFEVYDDVTTFTAAINRFTYWLVWITVCSALLVNIVLILIVGRGDRLLQRQHERSLELARSVSRADAANRAKTEFLANMSHELRTPLNAIIGFSDLMLKQTFGALGDKRYTAYINDIRDAGQKLLETIDNMLDLMKIELGRMQVRTEDIRPKDLASEIVRMVEPTAKARQIVLRLDCDGNLPVLATDGPKLRKSLLSLLSNAIKFSPPGSPVILSCQPDQGGCRFAVIDRGIGMSAEEIPIALSPFRQVDGSLSRKFEGTGLGLPLAKDLVELLGGRLEVTSLPGSGTTVTICLPQDQAPQVLPGS